MLPPRKLSFLGLEEILIEKATVSCKEKMGAPGLPLLLRWDASMVDIAGRVGFPESQWGRVVQHTHHHLNGHVRFRLHQRILQEES